MLACNAKQIFWIQKFPMLHVTYGYKEDRKAILDAFFKVKKNIVFEQAQLSTCSQREGKLVEQFTPVCAIWPRTTIIGR